MVRQILRNGQITLPKEAINFFHLKERDLLDIKIDASGIHLSPLLTQEFSEADYKKLTKKLDSLKRKEKKGKVYRTSSDVRRHLDNLMQD